MLPLQILCLSHSIDQLPFLEERVVLTEDTTHSHEDWGGHRGDLLPELGPPIGFLEFMSVSMCFFFISELEVCLLL